MYQVAHTSHLMSTPLNPLIKPLLTSKAKDKASQALDILFSFAARLTQNVLITIGL